MKNIMRNAKKILSKLSSNQELNDRFFNITKDESNVKQMKILTWNFSFGHGMGSASNDYLRHAKEHYMNALLDGCELFSDSQADLIFLQEVDFHCSKTYYVDQVEFFAAKCNYNYAYGTSWDCTYVPYPILDIKNHFGQTLSGSGVLSKFPVISNKIYLLDKPKENFKIYNFFYPYRYLQVVTVLINGQEMKVGNLHLEAFKKESRFEQAKVIKRIIKSEKIDVFCGDFNTLPRGASVQDFGEDSREDYVGDKTFDLFNSIESFSEVLEENVYKKNESQYFTFPTDSPDRRLDFIFYNSKKMKVDAVEVCHKVSASDHLPVMAIVSFND